MRLSWIYLYLIGSPTVFNYVVGRQEEGYIQTTELGWWEARKKCIQEGNTDLFEPSDYINVPHEVGTYYWVGGFETSQWRWTDSSPLFTLMGHFAIPNSAESQTINGNSVFECYRQCHERMFGLSKRMFGLSGTKCYCLNGLPDGMQKDEHLDIESCPGNTEEYCGTQSLISVYKIDINFHVGRNGDYQCGYINKQKSDDGTYIAVKPGACQSSLFSVCVDDGSDEPSCRGDSRTFRRCEDDLCVSCESASWSSSNQSCSLVKVTSSGESQLTNFLYLRVSYWIGLHKHIARKWVNGKEVHDNFEIIEYKTDPGPRCLAMILSDTEWTAYWILCNEKLQSLCSTRHNSTEHVGSSSSIPPDSRKPDQTLGTSPQTEVQATTLATVVTVATEKGGNMSADRRVEGADAIPMQSNGNIGVIIGAVIGVMILVAVILFIILSKRKGKFCFKSSNENKQDQTIAMDNVAYMSPNSHQNDLIHGRSQHGVINNPVVSQRRPGHDDNKLTSDEEYNTTRAIQMETGDTDNLYNHLGDDEDNYDIAGVHRVDNVHDTTYDHTGPKVGSQQFVVDGDTYNHTGLQVVSNVKNDIGHETYNHTENSYVDNGQSPYNNLAGTGLAKSTSDVDQCYNHLMVDGDNDYDTTGPVVDKVHSDTYNHTSPARSQGAEMSTMVDNSSDYYNL